MYIHSALGGGGMKKKKIKNKIIFNKKPEKPVHTCARLLTCYSSSLV